MILTTIQNILKIFMPQVHSVVQGSIAQSVMCLAVDACLAADPGFASLIPARPHTFMEIDHEIISTVILLPAAESIKYGCCHRDEKVLD